VGQELAATLDLHQVIKQSLKAVTETIGAEGASIWLWDEERVGWLTCRAVFLHDQNRSPINLRLRPGQGIAGWVAQKGQSLIVPRASNDTRFYPKVDAQTGFRTLSLLTVPLRVHDEVIGVLQVVNKLAAGFDENDRTLVETLAASAAIAIENARLVESLRQRTVELQASNEELDAFAHTVAHGLKNPLGRVIGFAQALEEDYASLPDEELRRFLHIIAQSGYKMNRIIDALLLLAGLREMEVEIEPLDMASIVAEVQQRLAHMIQEYQADIVLPDAWPVALGYGPWVEEVWTNYISNALKYGGQPPRLELGFGSHALSHQDRVSIPEHEFKPQAQSDSRATMPRAKREMARFWIKDNGAGITSQDQARLFTPFTRINQISAHGHGVGLSIVQRIVDKLGGQVGVESEIGVGSVFWFTLPTSFF
jgi:signal transduction histidine kinase